MESCTNRHYLIEYEDGDKEHMTYTKVRNHLPRLPFTGGHTAALESVLTKNATMNAIALENLGERGIECRICRHSSYHRKSNGIQRPNKRPGL